MSGFFKEFKEFAMRGNVIDMAVGVIIGGAFGKIVSSLVNDVFMPVIGVLTGGIDFSNLNFKFQDAEVRYGVFLQNVVDFLIVAFCIFLMVKAVNKVVNRKAAKAAKSAPAELSTTEKLLTEIRDELRKERK